jgi:hypothetical protein
MDAPEFSSDAARAERDGSCPDNAIIVRNIAEEYEWIRHHCPDFTLLTQHLQNIEGKPYDVLTLRAQSGADRDVYFDISQFFGQEKGRMTGPPCPYCGGQLRTAKAKQCRECGMDWHDPANVVCTKRP